MMIMELETWIFCYDFVLLRERLSAISLPQKRQEYGSQHVATMTRVQELVCTERDLPILRVFLASGTFSWSMRLLPMLWMP